MNPSVLVLILNYNGKDLLADSVPSYLNCEYANFSVAVIDNGSTDGTAEYLQNEFPNVILIRTEKNLGYSGGMNLGLSYAFEQNDYDFVLISNNDVVVDKQIISALVETATAHEGVAFTTGKVYYSDSPLTFQTLGKSSDPILIRGGHIGRGEVDKGQYDRDCELDFCDDIFWLVSKEVYLKTGGYDPEFFLEAEDFDWQLRAKKVGFKIMFAHKAKLWHKESMTLGKDSPRKAYYDARNPMIAVMKNCEPDIVKKYLRTRIYKIYLPAIIKTALKGKIQKAIYMFAGVCSALIWKANNRILIKQKR